MDHHCIGGMPFFPVTASEFFNLTHTDGFYVRHLAEVYLEEHLQHDLHRTSSYNLIAILVTRATSFRLERRELKIASPAILQPGGPQGKVDTIIISTTVVRMLRGMSRNKYSRCFEERPV